MLAAVMAIADDSNA